jgi:HlyD family secretion protein
VKTRLAGALVVVFLAGATLLYFGVRRPGTPERAANAHGTVRAVSLVLVRPSIAGEIKEIAADFQTRVTNGQVLARIDPASFEQRVNQARADVAAARAAKLAMVLRQRETLLKQAQADLERTVIRAPVDGTVVLRNADVGQTVTPGAQAPALFAIAPDLRTVQVEAALDDPAMLRPGMAAEFSVDALPGRTFTGEIHELRKGRPSTAIIAASNADLALMPGMTANVRIPLGP